MKTKISLLVSLLLLTSVIAVEISGFNSSKIEEKGYIYYDSGPVGEIISKEHIKIQGIPRNLTMNITDSTNLNKITITAICGSTEKVLNQTITFTNESFVTNQTICSLRVHRKLFGEWDAWIDMEAYDADGNEITIEEW